MKKIDIVFFIFILVVSFDPTNQFTHMKDILFVIIVGYGLLKSIRNRIFLKSINRIIIASFVFIPLFGILVATMSNSMDDPDYAYGQIRSMLFIFLFFYMITMKLNLLLKVMWVNGILLSIATLLLFSLGQYNDVFYAILYENREINYMMALKRDFLGIEVSGLYFKTGGFIIFAFIYNLYYYHGKFKMILSVILYLALLFAGSRTPALIQTLILLIYIYDSKLFGKYSTKVLSFAAIIAFGLLVYALATQEDEKSNEMKYDNYPSYIDDLSKGGHAIWGGGLGSTFYAAGRDGKRAFTELSYMDVLRIYGIPLGVIMIFLFFSPYFFLKKYFRYSLFLRRYCLGYVLFLILCGTNPLLLGSIGLTALSMFMAIVNKTRYAVVDRKNKTLMIEGKIY